MKIVQSMRFKTFCVLSVLFTVFVVSAADAVFAADAYPSKPIRIIVPYAAGGSVDMSTRLVANKLSERIGKQVILDFRAGGGSIVGTEVVAKEKPDGYTLLGGSSGMTILPALRRELPFDVVKSFVPIAKTADSPTALVVHPSVPAKSVRELIALAKQKPNEIIFVTSGIGVTPHMATELFKMMADIDIKIVHFKGVSPATVDLLGGHSHAMFGSGFAVLPHVKSGKLRILATTGLKRSVFFPDVPTIAESGLPNYETDQWYGILAPAGTPAPIVDKLTNEIKAILAMPEMKKQFQDAGAEADYMGPSEFAQLIQREITKWQDTAKKANIQPE
jgi:tripartite-type tricarboxylate transporter receptor subunit TctC